LWAKALKTTLVYGLGSRYLYYVTSDGNLVEASTVLNGTPIHSVHVGNPGYVDLNLDSTGGVIYVSHGSAISAFNAATLAPLWTFTATLPFNAPALALSAATGNKALYFVDTAGNAYSVDAASGALIWLLPLGSTGVTLDSSTSIDEAGNIIVDMSNVGVVDITNGAGVSVVTGGGGVTTYPSAASVALSTAATADQDEGSADGTGNTVTATVSAGNTSNAMPTGSVDFYANGIWFGNAPVDASGNAAIALPNLPAGSYNITAAYSGDTNFFANIISVSATINPGNAATDASAPTETPVALSVAIDPASGMPMVTLTFADGTTATAIALGGFNLSTTDPTQDAFALAENWLQYGGNALLDPSQGSNAWSSASGITQPIGYLFIASDGSVCWLSQDADLSALYNISSIAGVATTS
jgi:hypothetical protein